jgi:TolA-binding protein
MSRRAERALHGALRSLIAAVALAAVAGPALAVDKGTADRLREIEGEVQDLSDQVSAVRVNFTERSGLIGVNDARKRYEDAVYLYLVGEYDSAATSFYILVQSRALGNAELARDSEWYLAECLFELENYATAEEAYRAIVSRGETHPFFRDAIRRSLEVYGLLGDTASFDRYYTQFIASGKVPPNEQITYTLAKSFYRRGEYARAKAAFESVPSTSVYFTRARYFLGVLMIVEKNYSQAVVEFSTVEAAPVTDDAHKQIRELATMALARVYYEIGDFERASSWYSKVGKESPYFSEQLYESVWSFVKQENWAEALQQVDIFLLAFPENRYTSGLKLLQGHLHMKIGAYEQARTSYERVVEEYSPLVTRLDAVSAASGDVGDLVASLSGTTGARLPAYASEMLLGRDDVARATSAVREMGRQEMEVLQSDRAVKELEVAVGGSDVLGAFVAARSELGGARGAVVSVRDRLLEAESSYLRTRVPSAVKPELAALQKERASAMTSLAAAGQGVSEEADRLLAYEDQFREVQQRAYRIAQLVQEARATASSTLDAAARGRLAPEDAAFVRSGITAAQSELAAVQAELERLQSETVRRRVLQSVTAPPAMDQDAARSGLVTRYDELRKRLAGMRRYATDADASAVFAQIDRVWADIERLEGLAEDTRRVLTTAEARELSAVRSSVMGEAQRVAGLQKDVDAVASAADTVAAGVLRGGIEDLEAQFRQDVLDADKGIVDVYWLRKSATSEEMTSLAVEQSRLLRELDERYRIVRENLER